LNEVAGAHSSSQILPIWAFGSKTVAEVDGSLNVLSCCTAFELKQVIVVSVVPTVPVAEAQDLLPAVEAVLPVGHASHLAAPLAGLKVPTAQLVQVFPSVEALPAEQASQWDLPANGATVPGSHATHSFPSVVLYLPASHLEHVVAPAGETWPE
jgi:hypothetical protein